MSGEKAASKASMGMIKGESEIQSDVLRCLYDLLVGGIPTMWGPPVISWCINPHNYSYKYHKP